MFHDSYVFLRSNSLIFQSVKRSIMFRLMKRSSRWKFFRFSLSLPRPSPVNKLITRNSLEIYWKFAFGNFPFVFIPCCLVRLSSPPQTPFLLPLPFLFAYILFYFLFLLPLPPRLLKYSFFFFLLFFLGKGWITSRFPF